MVPFQNYIWQSHSPKKMVAIAKNRSLIFVWFWCSFFFKFLIKLSFSSMSTDLTTESSIYLAIIMAFFLGANFEPGERLQAPRSLWFVVDWNVLIAFGSMSTHFLCCLHFLLNLTKRDREVSIKFFLSFWFTPSLMQFLQSVHLNGLLMGHKRGVILYHWYIL
jgi:hypothetical protein